MGKSLKGKELGRGLYQRSDGLYVARIYTKTTPKKKASYRWIPMSKKVENAFLTWKVKQDMDKEKYGSKWGRK